MKLDYQPGSTPLNPDELEGLIPAISTQGELNMSQDFRMVSQLV